MKKISIPQWITLIVTIAVIAVNGLANALPINGQGTGEISDRFNVLFVPAGYVFSIWGLIYAGLIAFSIYQALPAQKESPLLSSIRPLYWFSSLANVVWLFLWHYEVFSLTLIAMVMILTSLLAIYMRIVRHESAENKNSKWFVNVPFSVYLGWISVATIANVSQVLFLSGWNGFGISPAVWTVILVLTASMLGVLMLLRERNAAYALVLVWAFAGIALKHADLALLANTVWAASGLLTIGALLALVLKK